jgi:CubicO group peptidase (beta-lactamase class C family)
MEIDRQRVDQIFKNWDRPDSPGCVLGIIQDEKMIYSRGYGMADLEHNIAISPASVFDIGSVSKQFTALCALILARRGVLSLDDDVQRWVPELPVYEHPIKIRHLIHHTSGLRDYLVLMEMAGMRMENEYREEQVTDLIAHQKALNFQPGEEYLYSNSGYFLLALIVKRASGQSLRQFAAENIFTPLGMTHTHIHDDFTEITPNRAMGYASKPAGGFRIDMSIFDVVGDGAVYTTLEDLQRWDSNFYHNQLDGGGAQLIEQMQTVGRFNDGREQNYAFGLMIGRYRGLPFVRHGGAWAGYKAELLRFPQQRFSVIILANQAEFQPSALAQRVVDIVLQPRLTEPEPVFSSLPVAPIRLSKDEMQKFAGRYYSNKAGSAFELLQRDGQLYLEYSRLSLELAAVGENRLHTINTPYSFFLTVAGDEIELWMEGQIETDHFVRVHPVEMTADQRKTCQGSYHSGELGVDYGIVAGASGLALVVPDGSQFNLKSLQTDTFFSAEVVLRFIRKAGGEIMAFEIDAGRVKGIVFERN